MAGNPRIDPRAEHGRTLHGKAPLAAVAPLAGTRDEAMQRLRIGVGGLLSMIIIVGLATIIYERANQIDATAVPQAAPTVEPSQQAPKNDPLADAGVVPDLPADPTPLPVQEPAIMPEQGDDIPAQ